MRIYLTHRNPIDLRVVSSVVVAIERLLPDIERSADGGFELEVKGFCG